MKCISLKPPTEMKYKKLTQQNIIQENDEYKTSWGSWTQIESEFVGKRKGAVLGWYIKMRRTYKGE